MWDDYQAASRIASQWNFAVTDVLVAQYGPWAFDWAWSPGLDDYVGELVPRWDFWEPISTSQSETLRMVADALVQWRRWLEDLAARFDRLLPSLRQPCEQAERGGTLAAWEAAISHLMATTTARAEDNEGWQGLCGRVLTWFLNAAGIPEQRAATLVGRAIDARFDHWVPLSAADIADVAERLAREIVEPGNQGIPRPGQGGDDWPDTWPDGWPSWRATNLPRKHS
ncbi:hypothetical protein AB0J90_01255 [Micromonospora sp. NPDC049523]|uniref:hypothetical protein n=1 Tax=Micromonospora sp. NPDC049523 TaxID=3155921 RepID=UPI003420425A